jgi:hypothetical protein
MEWDSQDNHLKGFRTSPEFQHSLRWSAHFLTTLKKLLVSLNIITSIVPKNKGEMLT